MAHQARAGLLIVARHPILRQVGPQGPGGGIRLGLLDEAGGQVRYAVGPGPVKAHFSVRGDGVLALIAVVQGLLALAEARKERKID